MKTVSTTNCPNRPNHGKMLTVIRYGNYRICILGLFKVSTEFYSTDHLQQAFYIAAACVLARMTSGAGLFVNTWNLTFREWASFGYVSYPTIVTFQQVADSGQRNTWSPTFFGVFHSYFSSRLSYWNGRISLFLGILAMHSSGSATVCSWRMRAYTLQLL